MNDYDFQKDILKPNKIYNQTNQINSPKYQAKTKTYSTTSRSNQKHIITSFSKKLISPKNTDRIINVEKQAFKAVNIEAPIRKSHCESQYYIKKNDNKPNIQIAIFQDGLKVKDVQIQQLSHKLSNAETLIKRLQTQISIKSQRIQTLEGQINTLLIKTLKNQDVDQLGTDLMFQCHKYKFDQRRLLKMLQGTAQYENFAKIALLDEGIEFLRIPHQIKKEFAQNIDASTTKRKNIHFCSCNKELIAQTNFWVPQKLYNFGKQFIKQRKGDLTTSQYELLLYELNRIWRQRQKKIILALNIQKTKQIQKIKRTSSNYNSADKKSRLK